MINIILDSRETKLIHLFNEQKIVYQQKQLDIGDIIFIQKNSNKSIIIERKSINDLISSIKDGRYKEQKSRLLQASLNDTISILYLLEGNIDNYNQDEQKLFYGAWISIMMRDQIPVIRTNSIKETTNFLIRYHDRLTKDDHLFKQSNQQETSKSTITNPNIKTINYTDNIKLVKKDNITPKYCQIIYLASIPGVSTKMAEFILEEYQTLTKLLDKYKQLEEEKEKENLLSKLQYSKTRKIGPSASKKIYNYLVF